MENKKENLWILLRTFLLLLVISFFPMREIKLEFFDYCNLVKTDQDYGPLVSKNENSLINLGII